MANRHARRQHRSHPCELCGEKCGGAAVEAGAAFVVHASCFRQWVVRASGHPVHGLALAAMGKGVSASAAAEARRRYCRSILTAACLQLHHEAATDPARLAQANRKLHG